MKFKELNLQQEYNSLEEDVIRDFFIPTLSCAKKYDRAAGFFSSSGFLSGHTFRGPAAVADGLR